MGAAVLVTVAPVFLKGVLFYADRCRSADLGRNRQLPEIARVAQAKAPIATTIVIRVEIPRGRIEYLRKAATGADVLQAQQWLNLSEELLALIEIVSFDAAAALLFDGLRRASGLLIASIALARRATLVTRTLRHFQTIPRLSVENWMD